MRAKYITLIIASLFLTIITSCDIKDQYTDDEFILKKTDYKGNELSIDGYYYHKLGENSYYVLIFYRNGTIFKNGASDHEEYIANTNGSNVRQHWGLFIIENNTIKIEYYMPKMYEGLPAYIKAGEILNDTTFIFKEQYRSKDDSEYQEINETYHFKKFSPKPDSTNNFI